MKTKHTGFPGLENENDFFSVREFNMVQVMVQVMIMSIQLLLCNKRNFKKQMRYYLHRDIFSFFFRGTMVAIDLYIYLLLQTRIEYLFTLAFIPLFSQRFTLHIMKNHILSGRFPLNNMSSDLSLTTLAGTILHIKKLTNVRSRICKFSLHYRLII